MKYIILVFVVVSCRGNGKENEKELNQDQISKSHNSDSENILSKEFKIFKFNEKEYRSKTKRHKINNIYYTATLLPVEYYIKKNLGVKDLDSLKVIKRQIKNEQVLEFEFEQLNGENLFESEYANRSYKESIEYLSFKIKKDFYLINQSKDTLRCDGVLFERNFQLAPYKKVLLFFKNVNKSSNLKLIYNDEIFGNGIIKFNFKSTN